jgi:Flp pilus assembly protein TadD
MISAIRLLVFVSAIWATTFSQVATRTKAHDSIPQVDDFAEAKRLLSQGSMDAAIAEIKRELPHSGHKTAGLNLLGVTYDQEGKHEEAIATFEDALKIDPRSVDTLDNLATSYASHGKIDLASRMFRQALRLQPQNRTANYNFAILLLSRNEPKEAITYLTRIPSPDPPTRLSLIRAYLDAGMTSAGLRAAGKLSSEYASETSVHFSLGVQLASGHQYSAAAHEFELANALQPGDFRQRHKIFSIRHCGCSRILPAHCTWQRRPRQTCSRMSTPWSCFFARESLPQKTRTCCFSWRVSV